MSDDAAWQKNVDTTKLSSEEMQKYKLDNAKRPPGQGPGTVLHQQGGGGLRLASAYPFMLAGCLVLAGVGTWAYYGKTKPKEDKTTETPHMR